MVAKHATAAATEATAAVESASAAAATSYATADSYARAAGVSGAIGGDGDPFVISARAAARAARLARVEVEAASEAARAAIEAAAKRATGGVAAAGGSGGGGGGGVGRELVLVENDGDNVRDGVDEGDYGNGFLGLHGDGERDQDDDDENGKRKRKNAPTANSKKNSQQHFSADPPRPIGGDMAVVVAAGGGGDGDDPAATTATARRRLLNGVGSGNGVYFDGGDGSSVRFRVSVTIAIQEEAAVKLGLPLNDRDERLAESKSSQSKSMPLVFVEKARFDDSKFVYGKKAGSSSAAAATEDAARLRQLFFPLGTSSQSPEFVFRGRHRAWVMRFFVYPPNKRQITSGLSPLIRDCFGPGRLTEKEESKRLSSVFELVAWRGQDNRSGGGGGGEGRRGGGGGGSGDDDEEEKDKDDEPGSVLLPSGQRVPALWFEFSKVKKN